MSFPAPSELKGAVQGTLLYLAMYGGILIPFQSFSKFYLIAQKKKAFKAKAKKDGVAPVKNEGSLLLTTKYYNSKDVLALAGDRAVGNVLEQALIFLPLYWMHALFVDPSQSLTIGIIYSATRVIYPAVYMLTFNGYFAGAIGLSTVPGYLVTFYLGYQVAANFVFA